MLVEKSTSISLNAIDVAYVEAKEYYGKLLAGIDKEMLPLNDVEGKAKSRGSFSGIRMLRSGRLRSFVQSRILRKKPSLTHALLMC